MTYQDERIIIKFLMHSGTHRTQTNKTDSYYKLNRADHVFLLRLRSGHNRLNAHLFNTVKIGQS